MAKQMTYVQALTIALNTMTDDVAKERVIALRTALERHGKSDVAKNNASNRRKAQTAEKRAALLATVTPVLRETMTQDMTVNEIFEAAKDRLPQDFTPAKVKNILAREMAPEIIKTERRSGPNLYRMA